MKQIHYNAKRHIVNLVNDEFYKNLILLRNIIEKNCDSYFQALGAPKIDLYMISRAVSSPMGKGSDSLPIEIKFGNENAYLVDSAQFGMEPLVQKNFEIVYCYLPSFRGETPDYCHLNQFYHCEAEIQGDYKKSMLIAENLIKHLIKEIITGYEKKVFDFEKHNFVEIENLITNPFPVISFDEAEKILSKNNLAGLIERRPYGRVLTRQAELKVCELVADNKLPVWVTMYDRDTVPFYQKPYPNNPEKVLNADLIFPSINGGYGGEILGSGQRQDEVSEIEKSMLRQGVLEKSSYKWYMDLRNNQNYKTTAGFGMGIERFIAWCLGLESIFDAAIYPVAQNNDSKY